MPTIDIVVSDDEVLVSFDVPDLDADSLEIELENDMLTLRCEQMRRCTSSRLASRIDLAGEPVNRGSMASL
jgi:HSP20 family molecular chaperone IbpA